MSTDDAFESAVQAVIMGDMETLKLLLKENPGLARERSGAEHRGTLLHYVAANGVENELQKTPPNAAEVAKLLLDAGADVEATFLDGGSGSTPLVSLVTSVHPHAAGVAGELVELFLDAGAKVEGLDGDGQPLRLAILFGYPESGEVLVRRGAQIRSLDVAAGLGRVEWMAEFLETNTASEAALDEAFIYACMNGQVKAAGFLLDRGAQMNVMPEGIHKNPCSGLHFAALNGHLEMVKFLVSRGADVTVQDPTFNGTPQGWAEHNGQDAVVAWLKERKG
ncbi:MAG: ankyrin repeat domain-containing protein [bacterium]|nr:ankyrin repeat domain-containing protein [bacterium]